VWGFFAFWRSLTRLLDSHEQAASQLTLHRPARDELAAGAS